MMEVIIEGEFRLVCELLDLWEDVETGKRYFTSEIVRTNA